MPKPKPLELASIKSNDHHDDEDIDAEKVTSDIEYIGRFAKYSTSMNLCLFAYGIFINFAPFVYNSSAEENSRYFEQKEYLGLY